MLVIVRRRWRLRHPDAEDEEAVRHDKRAALMLAVAGFALVGLIAVIEVKTR